MSYEKSCYITENTGNNAFSWEERQRKYNKTPKLYIPSLIDWVLSDVQVGTNVVFEEHERWKLQSCIGLKNFVSLKTDTGRNVVIFDNHNHALYFWIDAARKWIINPGFTLIHIDEHSDLWENSNELILERALDDEKYQWDFTNLSCNVGNYIIPAMRSGLVSKMIRIENESEMDSYMNYIPPKNTILNLDLDIFAPELDFIPEEKKLKIIRNLLREVDYVTIATSPFFINQWIAIEKLHKIFQKG